MMGAKNLVIGILRGLIQTKSLRKGKGGKDDTWSKDEALKGDSR